MGVGGAGQDGGRVPPPVDSLVRMELGPAGDTLLETSHPLMIGSRATRSQVQPWFGFSLKFS